ncbi:MAG: DUF488 family protein [Victivallaceae bacterium]|nr:DUF488 family protein [Victivallaceae bacterium]
MLKIKRIYDEPDDSDGFRILVDRLWPRGVTKQRAKLDLWLKDIAPSTELRKWFGHDLQRWQEFYNRFVLELEVKKELLELIAKREKAGTVTLLFAGRDEKHNEAVILKEIIDSRQK